MTTERFFPHDRGGSEWSVYHLIKSVQNKNIHITLFTPNYGAQAYEMWHDIVIQRFWCIPKSLFSKITEIPPIFFSNFIWYVISSIAMIRTVIAQKSDVIHVQSKSFIPAAIIVKYALRKPVIVTLRDYAVLCPYGYCLNKNRSYKKCSVIYHFFHELPYYYSNYVIEKSNIRFLFQLVASIHAYAIARFLRFFLLFTDKKICISKRQRKIFEQNGISIDAVIYNIMPQSKIGIKKQKRKTISFVGRVTYGKGADLFVHVAKNLLTSNSSLHFNVIGEGFLKSTLQKETSHIRSKIVFTGQVPYKESQKYIAQSHIVVVPSRWEEPFGRVALEAIANNVPVIVSNKGGLPEIALDNQYGYVVSSNVNAILSALKQLIVNASKFRANIKNDRYNLVKKFVSNPVRQHQLLYEQII